MLQMIMAAKLCEWQTENQISLSPKGEGGPATDK